jgi:hypothetical protein
MRKGLGDPQRFARRSPLLAGVRWLATRKPAQQASAGSAWRAKDLVDHVANSKHRPSQLQFAVHGLPLTPDTEGQGGAVCNERVSVPGVVVAHVGRPPARGIAQPAGPELVPPVAASAIAGRLRSAAALRGRNHAGAHAAGARRRNGSAYRGVAQCPNAGGLAWQCQFQT